MLHFRQDIWKTVKCLQVYLCGAFLPESIRDHRMEKHNGLIHIRVITLQISPWKCFWYQSDRCHYKHITLGCHCIKVNVENWLNLGDTFDRIKLASNSFICCNQATQDCMSYQQTQTHRHGKYGKCERSVIPVWNTMISSRPSKMNWSVGQYVIS